MVGFIVVVASILKKSPEYLWVAATDYTWEMIVTFLMELPVVAVIGPVFEELCCRVFPISSYETRRGRIIAGILTILLFSLLHVSNWLNVVPNAILFTVVYIITGNMALPILMHVANNLSTILVPMLAGIYGLCFPETKVGFAGFPIAIVILIVAAFAWGAVLLVREIMRSVKAAKLDKI